MTGKRFIVIDDGLDFMVRDTFTGDDLIDADGVADVLNDYEKENEQLKFENKNLKSILNDFINILNRLQSNPNNEQTLNVARDMLQNMGKEL